MALPALAEPPAAWKTDSTEGGVKVERRAVAGSSFEEVRLTTSSDESLQALCDAVWAKDVGTKLEGDFKKRVVIEETPTERWTYEQIHVPVVTDRDYVMRVRLLQSASSGHCEVSFETAPHAGYPEAPGHVRLKSVRGHWWLEPLANGQVSIVYQVYSDPGGSVPAFLARGSQRDAAVGFLKTILARAHRAKLAQVAR